MTITIDPAPVPIPAIRKNYISKYKKIFGEMTVGTSFTVPKKQAQTVRASFATWARLNNAPYKVTTRRTEDPNIYRFWVIAKND